MTNVIAVEGWGMFPVPDDDEDRIMTAEEIAEFAEMVARSALNSPSLLQNNALLSRLSARG